MASRHNPLLAIASLFIGVIALVACSSEPGSAGTLSALSTSSPPSSSSSTPTPSAEPSNDSSTATDTKSSSTPADPATKPSNSAVPSSAATVPDWTVEEAGNQYVESVTPYNQLIDKLNLLGPADDANLADLTDLAGELANADRGFKNVLDNGHWPATASKAVGALTEQIASDIAFWDSVSALSTAASYESQLESHFSDSDGSAAAKVREVLQLPAHAGGSQVGEAARNWGATVTVTDAQVMSTLPSKDGSRTPDSGGVFVVIDTEVTNDAKVSMDLTCGYPIGNKLIDAKDRQYDSVDSLYELPGNPECNANLQPGFTAEMRYAYMVPKGARITHWMFFDATDPSTTQAATSVKIDLQMQ